MKKVFCVIALAGLMVSCKDKKDEKKTEETTITPTTVEPTKTEPSTTTTTDANSVPTFSDPEVQKYVNDYTAFVTGYVEAYRTKDYTRIQDWSMKAADWSSRSMAIGQRLANTPDEATKFSNYITKLSQDITAAMNMK